MEESIITFFDGSVFRPLTPVDLEAGKKYIITVVPTELDYDMEEKNAISPSSTTPPAGIQDIQSGREPEDDQSGEHTFNNTPDHEPDVKAQGVKPKKSTPGPESGDGELVARKKFNPEDVIGKPYRRGMLPYGGAVTRGRISFAVSEEQWLEDMRRLRSVLKTPDREP
ncbi:MAG: Uncharacterized protein XE11_1083 [Methanomicrobiales archaeon 53_19]|uniref:hypothetical protein n=1 Tax=Methanocalculus sp. TaxID=2004547 RepID=UPI00074A476B|nr:hypothetical protein [Methanocalculus sp.]KUK69336.1 MAG: Uncharacterized protein XD88_1367 [Methanocalculus sp. 52_23]KUL03748.1 MAG: Uncharacterized protein XE11_1083 [Methanomicrobiales archaeon 53_19]